MTDDELQQARALCAAPIEHLWSITHARKLLTAALDEVERLRTTRDHSCACSVNDGSAPLVQHDKDCPIRVNLRRRISPELALQRLGAALDSSDEADELRAEREALKNGRDALSRDLCDLLARAHGDGGQYIDGHGLRKAVEDAHVRIAEAYMERDALRTEVERLRPVYAAALTCPLASADGWLVCQLKSGHGGTCQMKDVSLIEPSSEVKV
jgi:hypothetical protein